MIKYCIVLYHSFFVYSFTGFLGETEMGENHDKITYYNKKYTKIKRLGFIEKPTQNIFIVFYQ